MTTSPTRITNDDTTLDEEYEQQRIDSLPEDLQLLALAHYQDQFDAVPPYMNRYIKSSDEG